jgi:uncharacterized NAD(P)/FAD-binding protein YdhS
MSLSIAVVGLGSRGLGVLERIVTLAKRAGPGAGEVHVALIDPAADGAGVHGVTQPDYLLLNTTCAQVSLFPDAHTVGDEVDAPGPSLYEWVTARGLRLAADGFTLGSAEAVGPTGRAVRPTDFLPRRVLGEYLGWFFDQVRARAPDHVRITVHRAAALDLAEDADGLAITLSDGLVLRVGYAFLTTGYTPNAIEPAPRRIADPYPLPERMAPIEPGQVVGVGGFGLSAMDVMAALTVGRGGRYVTDGDELRYRPSGAEPSLLFFSRSGLPCRARPRVMEFGPPYRPVAFTPARIDAVRAARGGGPLDFDADLMPLVHTEMRVAYRRCEARLAGTEAALEWSLASGDLDGLLDDLDARLGPFDAASALAGSPGLLLDDTDAYQKWLAGFMQDDLAEGRRGFAGSPLKAGLDVLRELRDTFRYAVDFGGLTAASLDEFTRTTIPALNRAVVGPQYERHAELLALMSVGVAATPFGPEPLVAWDGAQQRWTIASTRLATPYAVAVDWLVAAHVGLPAVASSGSPLLRSLAERGLIRPHRPGSRLVPGLDVDRDMHPIDAAGHPRLRLWALGPLCEGATFYNNLVPSPNVYSRPIFDAHRCVTALFRTHHNAR